MSEEPEVSCLVGHMRDEAAEVRVDGAGLG